MNDFDRFLDRQLRSMLDPVVATKVPPRWSGRPGVRQQALAREVPIETSALASSPPEAVSVLELVVVPVSIDFPMV